MLLLQCSQFCTRRSRPARAQHKHSRAALGAWFRACVQCLHAANACAAAASASRPCAPKSCCRAPSVLREARCLHTRAVARPERRSATPAKANAAVCAHRVCKGGLQPQAGQALQLTRMRKQRVPRSSLDAPTLELDKQGLDALVAAADALACVKALCACPACTVQFGPSSVPRGACCLRMPAIARPGGLGRQAARTGGAGQRICRRNRTYNGVCFAGFTLRPSEGSPAAHEPQRTHAHCGNSEQASNQLQSRSNSSSRCKHACRQSACAAGKRMVSQGQA